MPRRSVVQRCCIAEDTQRKKHAFVRLHLKTMLGYAKSGWIQRKGCKQTAMSLVATSDLPTPKRKQPFH